MNLSSFFHHRAWRWALIALLTIAGLLLVFRLGVMVGYRKARFTYGWGEYYHRNFGGPSRGFFRPDRGARELLDAHGVAGTVIRRDGATLVVKGNDGEERIIIVAGEAIIRERRMTVALEEIKPDDRIVVLGSPDDTGQVIAKFIRLFR